MGWQQCHREKHFPAGDFQKRFRYGTAGLGGHRPSVRCSPHGVQKSHGKIAARALPETLGHPT